MKFEIPKPLQVEHEELHARLVEATRQPGAVGEAAREVARLLHPHFVREEEFALPPLALLEKLAREWLELERRRAPFQVSAIEEQRDLEVAGLQFQSRIDRMDKLADGGHVLIDYKSGRMLSPRQWEGPRPDDPQLPLYAVAAPEQLAAVVFAKVRTGEMRGDRLCRRRIAGHQPVEPARFERGELQFFASPLVVHDLLIDPRRPAPAPGPCTLR